jgi:hypothetical protein
MNCKLIFASLTALVIAATSNFAQDTHESGPFQGAKANKGFVTHTTVNGKSTLTLSDNFVPPQTPDPHWQVVDSNGKTYLLDRLMTKDQKVKKSIVVPETFWALIGRLRLLSERRFGTRKRLRESFRGFDDSNRYRESTMVLWRSCTWAVIARTAISTMSWNWPTMTQRAAGLNLVLMFQKH